MGNDTVTVTDYLYTRLQQFGIRGVHGVPGDFNLAALDFLEANGLYWVGNCNELNAAYAADGYARIKGMSALITTFGVGELSALNGIAGAYSEHVPVVHIVGMPNTTSQHAGKGGVGLLLHHTLGNGDFSVYEKMSRSISQTTTVLSDASRAAAEIDRVLQECYVRARPVYIGLPTDMVFQKIDATPLKTKIDISLPPNDAETEDEVVKKISELMYKSSNTVILTDACAIRHRVLGELHELMEKTKLPSFVTPMGKGSINETSAQFGGVYVGNVSRDDVKKHIEEAELVLHMGGLKSDFNSGGFTYRIETSRTVEFHSDHMKIRYSVFPGIHMNSVLRKLIDTLDYTRIRSNAPSVLNNELPHHERTSLSPVITHDYFWPTVGQSLREHDVIITETGTSNFGILETRFPANVTHISQVLYGSIGYSVGALQGAALAAHESAPDRRVVLFVGDGSLQLTVQEIATVIRHNLKPIIFVLNNNGYTIERMIHGMTAGYNDISPWKHQLLLEVFGAPEKERKSWEVKTRVDLERLFADKEFADRGKIQLVEVFMPQDDAPRALVEIGKITAKRNAGSGTSA